MGWREIKREREREGERERERKRERGVDKKSKIVVVWLKERVDPNNSDREEDERVERLKRDWDGRSKERQN